MSRWRSCDNRREVSLVPSIRPTALETLSGFSACQTLFIDVIVISVGTSGSKMPVCSYRKRHLLNLSAALPARYMDLGHCFHHPFRLDSNPHPKSHTQLDNIPEEWALVPHLQ